MGWAMQSIATNADGTVSMTFSTPGKKQTVTADHVILCMSFSVLRALDYSGANFDALKKTAIAQLGSGHNSKLQLQFSSRIWNAQGSNGNVYADNGFQNAWDVSRAQPGAAASSSTTAAAATRARSSRRRRTRAPRRALRWRPTRRRG
jgi:monoamine oxidase